MFRDKSVTVVLLEGRLPLEEIIEQLDGLLKHSLPSSSRVYVYDASKNMQRQH